MTIFIGIDPGLDGAVALIGPSVPLVADCPTIELKRRDYNPRAMFELLMRMTSGNDSYVFIEKISAGPFCGKDGKAAKGAMGMMGYGKGYGIWLGIIAALGVPMTEVSPVTWKKVMVFGLPKGKESSRHRALQIWPSMESFLARKKDHGRAEALLIAEFGRRVILP